MSEAVTAAVEWASSAGPPNWLFVVALLTTPTRWSSRVVAIVERRFGGGGASHEK